MFQYERKELDKFLSMASYPTSRDELIEQANRSKLPHLVVLLLQRLEDRQYQSADEVEQELSVHKA